jgi:hypothetical protein
MDGNFFSLFPREINKEIYTLTNVKYTPVFSNNNFNELTNKVITNEKLLEIIKNMENEVLKYYKDFNCDFKYKSYFTYYKCKLISATDNRDCNIEKHKNIITVNCGKILGIFALEDYINNVLKL